MAQHQSLEDYKRPWCVMHHIHNASFLSHQGARCGRNIAWGCSIPDDANHVLGLSPAFPLGLTLHAHGGHTRRPLCQPQLVWCALHVVRKQSSALLRAVQRKIYLRDLS